jgi:hypothetical protein
MEWIETVLMEQEKMRNVFDINKNKVLISLDKLAITTTRRTTALVYVSLHHGRPQGRARGLWPPWQKLTPLVNCSLVFTSLLYQTTTRFENVWANKYGFAGSLEETLRKFPNFRWDFNNRRIFRYKIQRFNITFI